MANLFRCGSGGGSANYNSTFMTQTAVAYNTGKGSEIPCEWLPNEYNDLAVYDDDLTVMKCLKSGTYQIQLHYASYLNASEVHFEIYHNEALIKDHLINTGSTSATTSADLGSYKLNKGDSLKFVIAKKSAYTSLIGISLQFTEI